MKESVSYRFTNTQVKYFFDAKFSSLSKLSGKDRTVLITDDNIYRKHIAKFRGWNTIVIKPGEEFKVQATVDSIVDQLIAFQADRQFTLVGVGGGVVTDLTGYVASVYMRGISFGFVPTSLLAMVDASIGGKNGIDVGPYKNMVGVIKQPSFLLFDFSFLETLPDAEWSNGFAEIIKHACILDATAFRLLEKNNLASLKKDKKTLFKLIERNARLKSAVVQRDEYEKGDRRLLNFGHTLGHALETQYILSHGEAVSIGMTYACHFSEGLLGFNGTERVVKVLEQFGLPTHAAFKTEKVFEVLKMDKKRVSRDMNYIMLEKIGKGVILTIPLKELEKWIKSLQS
jgi:3-dehydroquinate synthase